MAKKVFIFFRKLLKNLYEYLQEEPEYLHPKMNFLPPIILNLFSLLIWVAIFFLLVSKGFQILIQLFN
jgi:hypothetical protein